MTLIGILRSPGLLKLIQLFQEAVLLLYMGYFYGDKLRHLLAGEVGLPGLTTIFILSGIGLSLLIIPAILRGSPRYWELFFFRLGAILTLILYMLITQTICMLCLKFHLLVILLSLPIFVLNRFQNRKLGKE